MRHWFAALCATVVLVALSAPGTKRRSWWRRERVKRRIVALPSHPVTDAGRLPPWVELLDNATAELVDGFAAISEVGARLSSAITDRDRQTLAQHAQQMRSLLAGQPC